jgi:hypothetical protein
VSSNTGCRACNRPRDCEPIFSIYYPSTGTQESLDRGHDCWVEKNALSYHEILLLNGKYSKAFNQCLRSKPADYDWIRANCRKNDEFKNAFQCVGDAGFLHVWFVYESIEQCESVRKPMKERMDALRE